MSPLGQSASPQRRRRVERRPALLEHHRAQAVGPRRRCRRRAAISPASTRSRVLLPLPLGPSRPSLMPGVRIRSRPANSGRPPSDLAMPGGGEQLARLPAGGDEVDAGRAGRGVAVLQLGQLLAALGGLVDARSRPCALRAAALRPSHSVSRRTWLATDSCRRAWPSRNSSRRSAKSS